MVKLSKKLADLSERAKSAEDAVNAAETQVKKELAAMRQQAHLAALAAAEKVSQDVQSARDHASRNWDAMKTKVNDDIARLKASLDERRHDRDVARASEAADWLEWGAEVTIDYAIAAIEDAKLAVIDAIEARRVADEISKS